VRGAEMIGRAAHGSRRHSGRPERPFAQHACKMGLEGIVSKRVESRYRSAGVGHG
jgi:ATP-dependent DNA ligase